MPSSDATPIDWPRIYATYEICGAYINYIRENPCLGDERELAGFIQQPLGHGEVRDGDGAAAIHVPNTAL